MKSVFIGALLFASAFGQEELGEGIETEKDYISSLSSMIRGPKVRDNLQADEEDKWPTVQTPPEIPIDHQEAAIIPEQRFDDHLRLPQELQTQSDNAQRSQNSQGQLNIQKAIQTPASLGLQLVSSELPPAQNLIEQSHDSKWHQENGSGVQQGNLRIEQQDVEAHEKYHAEKAAQNYGKGLLLESATQAPSNSNPQLVQGSSGVVPLEIPIVEAVGSLNGEISTMDAVNEPISTALWGNGNIPVELLQEMKTQVSEPVVEIQTADLKVNSEIGEPLFSEEFPTFGELKVGV